MFLPELSQRIRSQREKRGLKQQDLANALHVSPQAVSKWERGENAPDIAALAPLAKLLGISVDWLLSANEEKLDVFEATILATSVSGAYEKSLDMAPRDFAVWANGLFYKLTELTLRHDGVPIKYMGDQYLCFFSGANSAARAIDTAKEAAGVSSEGLRMALNHGEVYLGSVGHPDYARPDVMGQVVNVAFLSLEWADENTASGIAATKAVFDAIETPPKRSKYHKVNYMGIERPVEICEVK